MCHDWFTRSIVQGLRRGFLFLLVEFGEVCVGVGVCMERKLCSIVKEWGSHMIIFCWFFFGKWILLYKYIIPCMHRYKKILYTYIIIYKKIIVYIFLFTCLAINWNFQKLSFFFTTVINTVKRADMYKITLITVA